MKRAIVILAVLVIVTGCAMWTKAPIDDPATPNNEAEDHAALVKEEEDKLRVGGEIVNAFVPPPFNWILPLALQGLFGAAAMRRA